METASSCVLFTNIYIQVVYMQFLTAEPVWKLTIIRVWCSHKHCYHAPVASWFPAYILSYWSEQNKQTNKKPKQNNNKRSKQTKNTPTKIHTLKPKISFQIYNFLKSRVRLASLNAINRGSRFTANVETVFSVWSGPVLSGFSEATHRVSQSFLWF